MKKGIGFFFFLYLFFPPLWTHADDYIIKTNHIDAIQLNHAIDILDQIRHTPYYKISDESVTEALKNDPLTEAIYKNSPIQLTSSSFPLPNDPKWSLVSMNFPVVVVAKNDVTIGLLDTGVDASHPVLKDYMIEGHSAIDDRASDDQNGHGTQMAGAIVQGSPQAIKLIPIQVLDAGGNGDLYSILDGLHYAINQKVDIINLSLGYPKHLPALEEAISKAVAEGIIVVAAAGNEGYSSLLYPGAYEPVIAIGAYNREEMRSSFSQFGPTLDFVAPGEAVYTTDLNKSFKFVNGTSISTALMTKAIAWLFTHTQERDLDYTLNLLRQSAIDMGTPGFDHQTGYGKIDVTRLLLLNEVTTDSIWKTWGEKEAVASHKIWHVDFSAPLSTKLALRESIVILDRDNQPVKGLSFDLQNNGRTLVIHPPADGFILGNYTLYIRNKLYSQENHYLKQAVKLEFDVR